MPDSVDRGEPAAKQAWAPPTIEPISTVPDATEVGTYFLPGSEGVVGPFYTYSS